MNRKTFKMGGILAATLAMVTSFFQALFFGPPIMRARTTDVAFTYRMGGGFPGEVNRFHPASILPGLINTTSPPRAYGEACLVDSTNGYRAIIAADQSTTPAVAVVMVRPFPTQQTSGGMTSALGSAAPPTSGIGDFLRQGFIIVKLKAGVVVKKGDPCWVWAIATAGANIQGEWQAAATASSTLPIANARFNGPADANGFVEVEVWAA